MAGKEEALSPEEEQSLLEAFKELEAKPKVTTAEGLREWMMDYLQAGKEASKDVKPDIGATSTPTTSTPQTTATSTTSASTSNTSAASTYTQSKHESTIYTPRISTFF